MSEPARTHEVVSVVFAANDYYTPYLSTLLASILAHRTQGRIYELMVLSRDFGERNKRVLEGQAAEAGASLRFVDVAEAMQPFEGKLRTWAHFKVETYYRLLLPQLLPTHHKVLYLDADMVCRRDVSELFDTDVEGYLIAACKDPDTTGIYNGVPEELGLGQPDKRGYMDNVLKIKNPYEYFQAGTILFNLDEWRARINVEEVFEFAQAQEWQLLDQDVLNYWCQGSVRFVDMAWNVMFDNGGFRISDIISHTTPELYAAYMEARKDPFIVHYAGPFKPWSDPDCDYAEVFWHYARMTPFYESMLFREARDADRRSAEKIEAELRATTDLLLTVDAELQRYEHRSLGLMAKEFAYQKVLSPLARAMLRSDAARERLHGVYRKVHPEKDA